MQLTEELKEGELSGGFPWGGESVVKGAAVWQGTRGGSFIVTRATTVIVLYY
jgi:hypothetical protein